MKKKTIQVRAQSYFYLHQSAIKLIEDLQQAIEEYGDSVYLTEVPIPYEDGYKTELWYEREETDEEYAERTNKDAHYADLRQKEELAMLAKLKAKYGEV